MTIDGSGPPEASFAEAVSGIITHFLQPTGFWAVVLKYGAVLFFSIVLLLIGYRLLS